MGLEIKAEWDGKYIVLNVSGFEYPINEELVFSDLGEVRQLRDFITEWLEQNAD